MTLNEKKQLLTMIEEVAGLASDLWKVFRPIAMAHPSSDVTNAASDVDVKIKVMSDSIAAFRSEIESDSEGSENPAPASSLILSGVVSRPDIDVDNAEEKD